MIGERYSIYVYDGIVIIYGSLTIEETFDFINYFEKKGFNEVGVGDENSTLLLRKTDYEHKRLTEENFNRLHEKLEDNDKEQKLIISDLKRHIKDQESVIKDMEQRHQRQMDLHKKDFEQNQRYRTLLKLRETQYFPETTEESQDGNLPSTTPEAI